MFPPLIPSFWIFPTWSSLPRGKPRLRLSWGEVQFRLSIYLWPPPFRQILNSDGDLRVPSVGTSFLGEFLDILLGGFVLLTTGVSAFLRADAMAMHLFFGPVLPLLAPLPPFFFEMVEMLLFHGSLRRRRGLSRPIPQRVPLFSGV